MPIMPIQIKAPDGSIAQFPDGTPDHVITSTMAKEYPQPTTMQTIAASPVGRLVHDLPVSMVEGLTSLAAHHTPFIGSPALGDLADKGVAAIEAPYQAALAAQRNRPGYAAARQQADAQKAQMGSGMTDQMIAPVAPAVAGTLGGLFGGSLNASNAAADAQTAAQGNYAKANPISAMAGQALGGLLAGPAGASSRVPVAAGDSALLNRAAGLNPANMVAAKPPVPTIAQLKSQAKAAYDKVDNSGQIISTPSYDGMVADLKTKLANEGIDTTLHPNAMAAYKRLDGATGQNITFKGIDTLRRVAGDAISAAGQNKADQRIGYLIQDHIDDFVNRLQPSDLVAGQGATDPAATVSSLNDARGLYARASQAQTIQNQLDKAALKSKMYSQSGLENATRAQFRQLALNDKAMARLSPDVRQAVKDVATGSPVSNVLRAVGKYAPHGPVATALGMGTGAMMGGMMGAAEGGLMSTAVPIVGEMARVGATKMTQAAAQRALETAALGRSASLPLPQPILRLPNLTPQSRLPLGMFGSSLAMQNQ